VYSAKFKSFGMNRTILPLHNRQLGGVHCFAMAILTLIIGIVLLGIGLLGHAFFTRQKRALHPDEHRARRWVVTIGSLVAGLWLVAFSAAQLLHYYRMH
jgi:hypothetical protein